MKLHTHLRHLMSLDFLSICIAASLFTSIGAAGAAHFYYTFNGTFTAFDSFNASVTLEDLGVALGDTVSYTFKVDFNRANSIEANSAATWYSFYSDLLGPNVATEKLNGITREENQSFDAYSIPRLISESLSGALL